MIDFEVVAAVNDQSVLEQNLLASPMLADGTIPVHAEHGCPSAGVAYNRGLKKTQADIVVFAHQDVYFPEGWAGQLEQALRELQTLNVPWAVLGVWGVNDQHQFAGRAWCSGGNQELLGLEGLQRVVSVDEIVIVLNRATGVTFDEQLPGFHLYATDVILESAARGFQTYTFTGPVVHNCRFNEFSFDAGFWDAYGYMQTKWKRQLPIETCCSTITRTGWPLYQRWLRCRLRQLRGDRPRSFSRFPGPTLAQQLGYELGLHADVRPQLLTTADD